MENLSYIIAQNCKYNSHVIIDMCFNKDKGKIISILKNERDI